MRRPQILEAYEACIVRHGIEGATLDRVAQEAGVTRGLVRHYLGNRDDVLRALGAHVRDRYATWLEEVVDPEPQDSRLSALLDAILGDEMPADLYQVVSELFWVATRDREVAGSLRETFEGFERTIDAELAAEVPQAPPKARRQVAFAILAMGLSMPDFRLLGFPANRRTAVRDAADRLVDSLR